MIISWSLETQRHLLKGRDSNSFRFAPSGMANRIEDSKFLQHQELKIDDNVCSMQTGGQVQWDHSHSYHLPSRVANPPIQSQIIPSAASARRTTSSWKDLAILAGDDAQFHSRCVWPGNISVRNGDVEELESCSHRVQHNTPFLPAVLSFRSIEGLDGANCSNRKSTTGSLDYDGSYSWGNHHVSSSVRGCTELLHPVSLTVSEATLQVMSTSTTGASSTSLPSTPTHVSDNYTVAEEYHKAREVGEKPTLLSKGVNIETISEVGSKDAVGYSSKHVAFADEGNSEGSGKSSVSQADEIVAWSYLTTGLCSKPLTVLGLSGESQFPNTSCFPIQETQSAFLTSINPFSVETNRGANPSLGAKEMLYRAAALQPINSSKEAIRRPSRRNVRISTDPQIIAARRRREKISDRIQILQSLVPGGTKMDTAAMLDEAIQYVKFLKRQVQAMESLSLPRVTGPMFLNSRSSPFEMNNSVSSSRDCHSHLNIEQMNSCAARSAGITGSGEAVFLCNLAREEEAGMTLY